MTMKKIWIWIVLAVIAVLLVIFKPRNKENDPSKQVKKNTAPTLVDGKVLKPSLIASEINVTGSILSNEEVTLQSQIAGNVIHIYFTEGSHVSKGDC